ncbi:MAG: nucleotidyl transferase AbiEii/AbiGii toxin family protein [Acidiphilium sp.]
MTLERVIRLIDILDAFGADVLIGPRIALKGGTALNVFHSDLDRLSVDIDINYVGAIEKERMDADRSGLEDRISRLMESKGYAARREPSEHVGGKWIYRYASALGGAGTIEIDINYLYRGPLYGVDRMPSAAIGSYRATNVPVLDIHEIVAGKLTMCLHDRYFDAFGGPVAWIENVTAECRAKLAPLFQLTAGERAFLDGVLERGEIDASSLDVPKNVRASIEASPALRWKAQNVKAWKAGDKSLAPRTRRRRHRDP